MKILIFYFVLFLVSFVGVSQSSKRDSLNILSNNNLLFSTKPSSKYVSEFKIDSLMYPNYFIDTLEKRYDFDLSYLSIESSNGFSDILVELSCKQSDGSKRWIGILNLSVIENLYRQGVLKDVVKDYIRIENEIESPQ